VEVDVVVLKTPMVVTMDGSLETTLPTLARLQTRDALVAGTMSEAVTFLTTSNSNIIMLT
jgi:hypothetical protein